MKYAFILLTLATMAAVLAITGANRPIQLVAAWLALSFGALGLAYAFGRPLLLFKTTSGHLHPASYLIYWPYHALNSLALGLYRYARRENPYDHIAGNIYLGWRLGRGDNPSVKKEGFLSTLDLTCEFAELKCLRECSYLCIPLLDTAAPTSDQLTQGAEWLVEREKEGPVYIHCAMGHGRSATFVAAWLLITGQAQSPEEAEQIIKSKRPRIGLNRVQSAALCRWHELTQTNAARSEKSYP
jgi:hypothetical protein